MIPKIQNDNIKAMFEAGAHYGYTKSRRNPSVASYILGKKDSFEIIDLNKTEKLLNTAKEFISKIASEGRQLLIVGGKKEAQRLVKEVAEKTNLPYIAGRWIGGTLTNFEEIQKRISRYLDLTTKREKGELVKYTKKERLLIDREIEKLQSRFFGLVSMKGKPGALLVIDPKYEKIAVAEASKEKIPVVALAGTDCDINLVKYPIVANDSSVSSVQYFIEEIVQAFREGLKNLKTKKD